MEIWKASVMRRRQVRNKSARFFGGEQRENERQKRAPKLRKDQNLTAEALVPTNFECERI